MKAHFLSMAQYNSWANTRLYRMANELPDEQYRKDVGAYFKSLHGTLNHLLVADRIWMRRLTGVGDHPSKLNAIVFDDLPSLTVARREGDQRIVDYVYGLTEAQFEDILDYQTLDGTPQKQKRREILAHLFNHQTHHRGQAHAILTVLGIAEPNPLDLLIMLREQSHLEQGGPKPNVIVRRLSADDPALSTLIALADEYLSKLYPAESNHLDSVAALAAPNVAVFGAYAGTELVACVASKIRDGDERYAEVKRLFVLESHRGSGLGKLLMNHLEDDLKAIGISVARLETGIKQPAAIRLYEKLGYVRRAPFAPYRPDPLSVFMEKRLTAD